MIKYARHWPIGITIVFILFALMLFLFILFALKSKTDLVERDYYRKGIQYQQQIDRIERTHAAADKVAWQYNKTDNQLIIQFPTSGTSGTILLYRPADASADHRYTIATDDSARQSIDLSSQAGGLWKLKVEWQIEGISYYTEEILVLPDH
jgi:hypothetical protein